MSAKAIICAQCGSNDISMETENIGVCNYCNTKYVAANETASDKPQVMIVHPVGDKQVDMRFCSLKSVWEPEQFARQVYIRLFSNPCTPKDIHLADFRPVVTEYPQFVRFWGDYILNYSVDLGYYRDEQYTVYEKREVNNETVSVPVIETRTVTDWRAFSGEWRCDNVETFGAVSLPEKSKLYKNFEEDEVLAIERYFANPGPKEVENYEDTDLTVHIVPPSSEDTQRAMKRKAGELAHNYQKKLPGDKQRDFSYSYSSIAKKVDWLVAPEYAFSFSYGGGNYEIRSFAAENRIRYVKMPKIDVRKEIKEEVRSRRIKTLCFPLMGLFCVGILFYVLFQLGILHSAEVGNDAFGFSFGLMIYLMIYYAIGNVIYWHQKMKQATTERIKKYQEEKLQHLQTLMQQMGMSQLSKEECACFFKGK